MPVDVQVFIDLEERMAATLRRAMRPEVEDQLRGLGEAARNDDVGGMLRLVDAINLGPAAESVRSELELIGLNAVLLGAAQFIEGKEVRLSRFVRDREIPPEVAMATEQLIRTLDSTGTEQVRLRAQQLVLDAEAADESRPGGISDTTLFRKQFGGLAGSLNAAVAGGTALQSSVGANLMTSRLTQFGALSQAKVGGIKTYQWNAQLDSRTCPVCVGMHGKVFSVGPALAILRQILRSQDPQVAMQLSPWPKQTRDNLNRMATMSDTKLQKEGFAQPPAHARCRCVLSILGTVPPNQIVGFLQFNRQRSMRQQLASHRPRTGARALPPEALPPEASALLPEELLGEEAFAGEALGGGGEGAALRVAPAVTEDVVAADMQFSLASGELVEVFGGELDSAASAWQRTMGRIKPKQFFDDMLEGTGGTLRSLNLTMRQGLDSSSVAFEAGVDVVLGGSRGTAAISRRLVKDRARAFVDHQLLTLDEALQGKAFARRFLANSAKLYERLGFTEMELFADLTIGGYAWARYGFTPTGSHWLALRNQLVKRMVALVEEGKVVRDSPAFRAMRAALADKNDPRSIWKVADIRQPLPNGEPLGRALLKGTNWQGMFDLTDRVALKRFKDYVGRK